MKKLNESSLQRYNSLINYTIREGRAPSDDNYYVSGKRVILKEADEQPPVDTEQGYTKKGDVAAPAPEAAPTTPETPQQAPAEPKSAADSMIPDMDGVDAPVDGAGDINMDGDTKFNVSDDGAGAPGGAADSNQSREDILSQLVKLHADKIRELEEFMQSMEPRVANSEAAAQAMPEVQAQIGQLSAQVEELTPPTPLQAMDKIIKTSGGIKPEDWFNNYFAEKHQNRALNGSPYYPKEKGDEVPKEGQKIEYVMKPSDLADLTPDQASASFGIKKS